MNLSAFPLLPLALAIAALDWGGSMVSSASRVERPHASHARAAWEAEAAPLPEFVRTEFAYAPPASAGTRWIVGDYRLQAASPCIDSLAGDRAPEDDMDEFEDGAPRSPLPSEIAQARPVAKTAGRIRS